MPSTVNGKLEDPGANGIPFSLFNVQRVDPLTRLPYGNVSVFNANGSGEFSVSLLPGFYQLRFQNDTLFFRVKENGKTYNFGDIVEPLK